VAEPLVPRHLVHSESTTMHTLNFLQLRGIPVFLRLDLLDLFWQIYTWAEWYPAWNLQRDRPVASALGADTMLTIQNRFFVDREAGQQIGLPQTQTGRVTMLDAIKVRKFTDRRGDTNKTTQRNEKLQCCLSWRNSTTLRLNFASLT